MATLSDVTAGVAGIVQQCGNQESEEDKDIEDGDISERRLSSNITARRLRATGRQPPSHAQEIVECVVDTSQATFFLGRAGLEITAAVKNCAIRDERLECASEVSGVAGAFGFVATYLSSATSECGPTANAKAFCAADISKVVAGLAEFSAAATAMATSCAPHQLPKSTTQAPTVATTTEGGDWVFGFPAATSLEEVDGGERHMSGKLVIEEPRTSEDGDWVFGFGDSQSGVAKKTHVDRVTTLGEQGAKSAWQC